MAVLFDKAWVQKANSLNQIKCTNMTFPELRFLSIYLSKINQSDISTRVVRFPISEFQRILEFGKLNIKEIDAYINNLFDKKVLIPSDNGGYEQIHLFTKCAFDKDRNGQWYVEFSASEEALPFMFDLSDKFVSYQLCNILRLKSKNQLRMYEILKQWLGKDKTCFTKEFQVTELRDLLGMEEKEYSGRTGWVDFKRCVLDVCQETCEKMTDLCYTYERGKTGRGGKWISIIFHIKKNWKYVDSLNLKSTAVINCSESEVMLIENKDIDYGSDLANLLGSSVLHHQFSFDQVKILQDLVLKATPDDDDKERCNYLSFMVHKMDVYSPKNEKRFNYLCKMIENDINDKVQKQKSKDDDFDMEKYKAFINKF